MAIYFDHAAFEAKEMVTMKAAVLDKLREEQLRIQRTSGKTHKHLVGERNSLYFFALKQIEFFDRQSPQALQTLINTIKTEYDFLNKHYVPQVVTQKMMEKFPDIALYDPLLKMYTWGRDLASATLHYTLQQAGIQTTSFY